MANMTPIYDELLRDHRQAAVLPAPTMITPRLHRRVKSGGVPQRRGPSGPFPADESGRHRAP